MVACPLAMASFNDYNDFYDSRSRARSRSRPPPSSARTQDSARSRVRGEAYLSPTVPYATPMQPLDGEKTPLTPSIGGDQTGTRTTIDIHTPPNTKTPPDRRARLDPLYESEDHGHLRRPSKMRPPHWPRKRNRDSLEVEVKMRHRQRALSIKNL